MMLTGGNMIYTKCEGCKNIKLLSKYYNKLLCKKCISREEDMREANHDTAHDDIQRRLDRLESLVPEPDR